MKKMMKKMHPMEQKAKMGVISDLQKMAHDAMGEKLGGLKKVTVASDSQEGLQHGLDRAQDMMSQGDADGEKYAHGGMYAEGGMTESHPMGALSEEDGSDPYNKMPRAMDDSHPDHENFASTENDEDDMDGMSAYPDADGDHDLEASPSKEHDDDEEAEMQPHQMSDDELEKAIAQLMEAKRKRMSLK